MLVFLNKKKITDATKNWGIVEIKSELIWHSRKNNELFLKFMNISKKYFQSFSVIHFKKISNKFIRYFEDWEVTFHVIFEYVLTFSVPLFIEDFTWLFLILYCVRSIWNLSEQSWSDAFGRKMRTAFPTLLKASLRTRLLRWYCVLTAYKQVSSLYAFIRAIICICVHFLLRSTFFWRIFNLFLIEILICIQHYNLWLNTLNTCQNTEGTPFL